MIQAFVLGKISPNSDKEVLEDLRKIENVEEVFGCSGGYDFIARISVENLDKLGKVVCEGIRKVKCIERTQTYICRK